MSNLRDPIEGRLEDRGDRIRRQIESLFTSGADGWGSRDYLVDHDGLFCALIQGELAFKITHLPREATIAGLEERYHGYANESGIHHILKWTAISWMRSDGAYDACDEVSCLVGRADAYSKKRNWVVEIGNTRLGKLVSAINSDHPVRFTLIPYQHIRLPDDRPRRMMAVDFMWHPGCGKWMRECADEMDRMRRLESMEARKRTP